MEQSTPITKAISDLIDLQADLGPVVKDAANPYFSSMYATLGSIIEYLRPLLGKHNFFLTQLVDGTNLKTELIHVSGERLTSEYPLHTDLSNPQKFGASITYARRYSMLAMLNLATEDDDGNTASSIQAPKVSHMKVTPPVQQQAYAKPSTVPEPDRTHGVYTPSFGKYSGRHLYEIATSDLQSYVDYLARSEKQSPQGIEFQKFAREEIERRRMSDETGQRIPF